MKSKHKTLIPLLIRQYCSKIPRNRADKSRLRIKGQTVAISQITPLAPNSIYIPHPQNVVRITYNTLTEFNAVYL